MTVFWPSGLDPGMHAAKAGFLTALLIIDIPMVDK